MKKKLLATLALTALTFSSLQAKTLQEKVETFLENTIQNIDISVEKVEILDTQKVDDKWNIIFVRSVLDIGENNKQTVPIRVLYNGKFFTERLITEDGEDVARKYMPNINVSDLYDDDHLMAGLKDAKHKIIVFSDPMCPYCKESVPGILEVARNNPSKIAVYYYSMPLTRIHPQSMELSKAIELAKKGDATDKVFSQIYSNDFQAKNMTELVNMINNKTDLNITEKDLSDIKVIQAVLKDIENAQNHFVDGTPVFFIDGKRVKNGDQKKIIESLIE